MAQEEHPFRSIEARILEHIQDSVIVTDLEARITHWNDGATRIFGYSAEEMLGKTPAVLYPRAPVSALDADLGPIGEGRDYVGLWQGQRKDGTSVWVEVRTSLMRGPDGRGEGFIGIACDVSAQKAAEDALHESEARLRVALDAGRMGTWNWNRVEGKVVWSSGMERMHGYPEGTFPGTFEAAQRGMTAEDKERASREISASIAERRDHRVEYRVVHPDGSVHWVEGRGRPEVDERGEAVRMTGICVDITERRDAEEKLRQRAQYEQQLIAIVSHDLRNPLAAVGVAASMLLRRGSLDPQQGKAVSRIVASTERATRLIRDFLDFASAREHGKLPIHVQPFNLHALADQVVDEVQMAYAERVLVLEHRGEGELQGDPDRIAQLLSNLITNAVQHSPPDAPVRIAVLGGTGVVRLEVHNGGPAIPPPLIDKLFEPFQRGEAVLPGHNRGVGLGLFIVKHVVDAHQGVIELSSSDAAGTTFRVTLPRALASAPK